jgi:hypothetical protein
MEDLMPVFAQFAIKIWGRPRALAITLSERGESDDTEYSLDTARKLELSLWGDARQGLNGQPRSRFPNHLACLRLDMQVAGRPRVEAVINGNQKTTNGSSARNLRPLAVDEALQYSPLTTSVTSGYGTSLAPRP